MSGDLTTIVGPMGSGKTLMLVKMISQYKRAGYRSHLFKHRIDTRDSESTCRSRAGYELPATTIEHASEIDREIFLDEGEKIIAFEEGQFFGYDLVDFVTEVIYSGGCKVIVTGLNLDFRGEPFGIMPYLMALSDQVVQLTGVCEICHGPATKTQRLIDGQPVSSKDAPLIVIGGDESYTCRCPHCFIRPI